GLIPGAALRLAKGVHLIGLPAVVMRAAVQVLIVHRSGLVIEEAVFFRVDDPAAYTVYEAPPQLGLAAAIAFLPTLVALVLLVGPAYTVAWITRFGGLLPALAGGLAAWWLADAVMRLL